MQQTIHSRHRLCVFYILTAKIMTDMSKYLDKDPYGIAIELLIQEGRNPKEVPEAEIQELADDILEAIMVTTAQHFEDYKDVEKMLHYAEKGEAEKLEKHILTHIPNYPDIFDEIITEFIETYNNPPEEDDE